MDHGKLIFHSKMINSENFILIQGAHAICCDNRPLIWGHGGWPIFHLPIRSKIQFMLKILQGIYSYLKIDPNARSSELGFHWFEMAKGIVANKKNISDLIRAFVCHYSRLTDRLIYLSVSDLIKENWKPISIFGANQHQPIQYNYDRIKLFVDDLMNDFEDQHITQIGKMVLEEMNRPFEYEIF